MLTRKYYRAIAKVIKETKPNEDFMFSLISFLQEDNDNFDKGKFLFECGEDAK